MNPEKMTLSEALDLETDGMLEQVARLRLTRASSALIAAALLMISANLVWHVVPERNTVTPDRDGFTLFPRQFSDWKQQGAARELEASVARTLGADDYRSALFQRSPDEPDVEFFSAWYRDQTGGNSIHSPEVCLPGGGWEIAWLERTDLTEDMNWSTPFMVNRAIIQKGSTRMMVYYWFDQRGRKIAWDLAAKYWLMIDSIHEGRTDGALVRLTTTIEPDESDADADARLKDFMKETVPVLSRFIPEV